MSKYLRNFIESPNVEIHFSGFKAHISHLQNVGWEISAHESEDSFDRIRKITLMLRFANEITLISKQTITSIGFIEDLAMMGNYMSNIDDVLFYGYPIKPIFNICGVSLDGQTRFVMKPEPLAFDFKKNDFHAIDASPQMRQIDLNNFDFSEFGVFRKINDSANIFLPEKTAHDLMKEILKKQSPKQAEIRDKRRKREAYGDIFERRANEDIKLQIVAI